MKATGFFAFAAMGLILTQPALADNWDQANCAPPSVGCNDSCATCGTNELVHGTSQVHDLDDTLSGLPTDEDWYFISLKPNSSYEIVVDGTTPFLNQTGPISVALVRADATVDTADQAVSSRGFSRSLRVSNNTTTVNDDRWVRVTAAGCGALCIDIDTYHISMRETTYYISRFNNSATQVSVLILQNPREAIVSGNVYFWNASGTLLNTTPVTLAARSTAIINTSLTLPGASGSITLSHNSTYGSLSGKIVAVEPASGFTFDTLMVSRVN